MISLSDARSTDSELEDMRMSESPELNCTRVLHSSLLLNGRCFHYSLLNCADVLTADLQ